MRAWHVPTSRQQALAASREVARSGQVQRQGSAAQPGGRVKVKQDEDRVAPGAASSPRDRCQEAPGAAGAAGERGRVSWPRKHLSYVSLTWSSSFLRKDLCPSLPVCLGSCPRPAPLGLACLSDLHPSGPPPGGTSRPRVPLNTLRTLGLSLPVTGPPPSQSCAPRPAPPPPTAVKPRGTQRSVSGVQGADGGEGAVLGKEGGHSRAAVRGG